VPTFHNEQLKQKRVKQETEERLQGEDTLTMDVELLSISENTPEVSTPLGICVARRYGPRIPQNAHEACYVTLASCSTSPELPLE